MNRIRLLLIAFLLVWAHGANAQIVVSGAPLFLNMDVGMRFKTTSDQVTLSAKLHANLDKVRTTFDSMIPGLNKHFECKIGPIFGATFSDIGPEIELLPTNKLKIAATIHVKDCITGAPLRLFGAQVGVPMGAIRISLPIVATARKFSIKLQPSPPQVSHTGIVWAAAAVSESFEKWLRTSAATELNKQVSLFEGAINKALLNPAVQKQIQLFQPRIDSIHFQNQGFSIGVTLQISGRATAAEVSKWLN